MDTKKDIKVSVFLDKEMASFIDENKTYGMRRSDYMRGLVWEKMKRKKVKNTEIKVDDFFNTPSLPPQFVPDDLKQYTDLLVEWWAIRYKNKGTCSKRVFNRIIDTLRKFPSQDRKEALEKAITGGWKDIYPLKKGYKPEEPKNNHPASRVFTAKGGFQ
jgi:hypothetical protein